LETVLRKQKILFFLGKGSYFLSHRLPTARAASELGYEIHVMAIDDDVSSQFLSQNFVLHPRMMQSDTRPILLTVLGFFQLLYLNFVLRPKVIHVIGLKSSPVGLLAALICWPSRFLFSINGLGFLFSSSTHSNFYRVVRYAMMKTFSIVSKLRKIEILFQNDDDKKFFENYGLLCDMKSHIVRGSGVEMDKFALVALPPPPITFGIACRMVKIKGVEETLQAFSELLDEGAPIRLLLAGDVDQGSPVTLTTKFLHSFCKREGIEWRGFVDDMSDFWVDCHVAVLPSHGGEGVPMSLLVAASMGRALLASDTNGNRDLVVEGENGFLCKPADVKSLKRAIQAYLEKFGKESRRIVLNKKMDAGSVRQAFEIIYQG
jgi:glycosyltransferase involved in cell wall biosynthesis